MQKDFYSAFQEIFTQKKKWNQLASREQQDIIRWRFYGK